MVMTCECCGGEFQGRRDAKTCSRKCREKARRRRVAAGQVSSKPVVALASRPAAEPKPEPDKPKPALVASIEKQLAKAERLDTPAGQMAVLLAGRMAAGLDTGSALATLSRELTARMAEALAGATVEPDELDELAERRLKKAASA